MQQRLADSQHKRTDCTSYILELNSFVCVCVCVVPGTFKVVFMQILKKKTQTKQTNIILIITKEMCWSPQFIWVKRVKTFKTVTVALSLV